MFRLSSSSFLVFGPKRYVGEFKGTRCLKKNFHIVLCEGGGRTYCEPSTFSPPMLKRKSVSQINEKTNKAKRIRLIHTSCTLSTTATETCYDCIHHRSNTWLNAPARSHMRGFQVLFFQAGNSLLVLLQSALVTTAILCKQSKVSVFMLYFGSRFPTCWLSLFR